MNKFYENSYQTVNIIEKAVLFKHQNTFYNGLTKKIIQKNNKEFNSGKEKYHQYYDFQYHRDKLSKKECCCAEFIPDLNEKVKEIFRLPKKNFQCEISNKSVYFRLPPKKNNSWLTRNDKQEERIIDIICDCSIYSSSENLGSGNCGLSILVPLLKDQSFLIEINRLRSIMELPSINEMSEQKLRRQYVKSITNESPVLTEFFSWSSLSIATMDFAIFSDKKNRNKYKVKEFAKNHDYFGQKKSRIKKRIYILSECTQRGNELNDKRYYSEDNPKDL